MTAYRDEVGALRHRLEVQTQRADRAEARLAQLETAREARWSGDVALFLSRCLLVLVPLLLAAFFLLYFGAGVVMLDLFDDTRGLVALYALFVSPLFVAGPLAALKTERPTRVGWALALFSNLYLLGVFAPAGLFGLAVFLRGRALDAVFGVKQPRVRVAPEAGEEVDEALEAEALEAEVRTSPTARGAG